MKSTSSEDTSSPRVTGKHQSEMVQTRVLLTLVVQQHFELHHALSSPWLRPEDLDKSNF